MASKTLKSVAANYAVGVSEVIRNAPRVWLNDHVNRLTEKGPSQERIAKACDMTAPALSRFLSGERPLTREAMEKLVPGLARLAAQNQLSYWPLTFPTDDEQTAAGWLHALNCEGEKSVHGASRPVGLVHYCCLRAMLKDQEWQHDFAANRVVKRSVEGVYGTAAEDAARMGRLVRRYAGANPLPFEALVTWAARPAEVGRDPTVFREVAGALVELQKAWARPWQTVYVALRQGKQS